MGSGPTRVAAEIVVQTVPQSQLPETVPVPSGGSQAATLNAAGLAITDQIKLCINLRKKQSTGGRTSVNGCDPRA
jgi:hypothetical protein